MVFLKVICALGKMLKESISNFAVKEIKPLAEECDKKANWFLVLL